jgi:chitin disaccharide deacetylase
VADRLGKKIIICADDFGISSGVSKGILQLAENNKISATSVMVCFDDWRQEAKPLFNLKNQIDIGLHFTLTGSAPLSNPQEIPSLVNTRGEFESLGQFIKKCFLRNINSEDVKREFHKQFDSFVEFFGFTPHYVDGHHNVHQYPVVNKVLIEVFKEKFDEQNFYIRNTSVPLNNAFRQGGNFLKIFPISLWGTPYKNLLEINAISTNSSFMGIYDWRRPELFGKNFKRFLLASSKKNGIIMTHPGIPDDVLRKRDVYNDGREMEFNFLNETKMEDVFESIRIIPSKFDFKLF